MGFIGDMFIDFRKPKAVHFFHFLFHFDGNIQVQGACFFFGVGCMKERIRCLGPPPTMMMSWRLLKAQLYPRVLSAT